MPIRSAVAAVSVALLLPALASARIQQTPAARTKGAATQAAPKQPASFRTEFLADLDEVQKKVTDLAAAVPADKYTWRPAEGVRSISEVYMHIAGGNYFLVTFLGIQPPADMPKEIESLTDKQKVLSELQKSFDHVRTAAKNTSDTEMEQTLTMLGNQTTKRGVFVTILNHLHEHLGQSIAYARMNGIVPPWSK
jgi:uncharacterized damage-inducible protein DinB